MRLSGWLRPGIGVKRWILVILGGLVLLALAGALAVRELYLSVAVPDAIQELVRIVTLQPLPHWARGVVLAGAGLVLFGFGAYRLVLALTEPLRPAQADQPLVEVIYQKRFLARGPRIVAIGGGTGLSTLLRGLKEHTSNLTAIVTVADDGGSSGVLREVLGVPPVGDIRNCIVALADAEPLMGRLLQYRFPLPDPGGVSIGDARVAPTGPPADLLAGHAVGNLLIAAMTAVEGGDFEEGVRRVNRVLAVRGQVLPASPQPLTLHARLRDGTEVVGQSRIARTSGIERVWVAPSEIPASRDAVRAIAEADAIVIGPGSLYTSLLPALLVPGIREAVVASPAVRIYVCNVATQPGETDGLDLADHVEALVAHTSPMTVDVVLANNDFSARVPAAWRAEHVRLRWPPAVEPPGRLVLDGVVDPANTHHHDPGRLATAIMRIVEAEAGSHRRPRHARSA